MVHVKAFQIPGQGNDLEARVSGWLNSLGGANSLVMLQSQPGFLLGIAHDLGAEVIAGALAAIPNIAGPQGVPGPQGETSELPCGELSYFDLTGTLVTIAAQSDGLTNMVPIRPATTLLDCGDFDSPLAGRLRYIGAATRHFHIAATWLGNPATGSDHFVMGVAKNGIVIPGGRTIQRFEASADTQSSALHAVAELAQSDYLEFWAGNLTAGRNITVKTFNLFAMGM